MKTNRRLLQTVLLASLLFLSLGTAKAETFQVNGIYYSILSTEPEGIVKVIANPEGEPYSGENITIPSTVYYGGLPCKVTSIDPYAFKNSTYSRVTISGPVKSIGQYAFQDCKNLTYVKIAEEVTAIQPGTFSGCGSLTDVVMPDGIKQIDGWAFSNCSKLAYIYHYSKNVQNGFHLLGWPTSLTYVGNYAFHNCNKLPDIPTSLYYIGDYAFLSCHSLTSVRIPATVSYIGTNPFAYCSGIESIVVDSDNPAYDSRSNCNAIVYTNYDRIISGCKNTTIPSDIKSIWDYSFAGQKMPFITIGQSVADIGMNAFIYCSDLKRVRSLATTPPTCGTDAFSGSTNLSSITLYVPNVAKYKSTAPWSEFGNILPLSEWKDYYTITYTIDGEVYATEEVAEGAVITPKEAPAKDGFIFYEWKGLPETMPGNHLTVEAVYTEPITFESDGLWYSLCYKGQVAVIANPSGERYVGNVTIPETVSNEGVEYSVTSIGKDAFRFCSDLTSITIPHSVTSIGYYAFSVCSGLTSITIPNSVAFIGAGPFSYCSALTSIVVEAGNTVFDSRNNCNAIIHTKTNYLINGCQSTIIPNSVTSIGDYAFSECSGLTSITIPNSVTSIGYEAFRGCSGLTSITIPNTVTRIGDHAFSECSGLTSIVVEDGNTIYDSRNNCNAFIETKTNKLISGCQSTIIPNSVTSIGNYAFFSCSSLTSITIPNSVTSIGDDAFYGCSGLTNITIPNSVTSIGNYAFSYCSGLTNITIPNSVTSIGNHAFFSCSSLTSITIPNSVASIGNYAFFSCSSLTSITIPNSVTSIGDSAFKGCMSLHSVRIMATTPPACDVTAFDGTNKPTLYVPEESVEAYRSTSPWNSEFKAILPLKGWEETFEYDGLFYTPISEDKVAVIESQNGEKYSGIIVIPETVSYDGKNYSVERIAENAFADCTNLTIITIPKSVTNIGDNAFKNCRKLGYVRNFAVTPPVYDVTEVIFQSGSPIVYVPEESMELYRSHSSWMLSEYYINSLDNWEEKFVLNGLYYTIINEDGVKMVENLEEIDHSGDIIIPDTVCYKGKNYAVKSISGTFQNCKNLRSITIPNTVTTIGSSAFYSCTALTNVIIPNSVTTIGYSAFRNCHSLTEMVLPNSVEQIESYAFNYCKNLVSITLLGDSIANISVTTFANCDKLRRFICYAKHVPILGYSDNTPSFKDATLYVPEECIDAYKTSKSWSKFAYILPIKDYKEYYTISYMVDGVEYAIHEIPEGTTICPKDTLIKNGYIFMEWRGLPETMPSNNVTVEAVYAEPITFEKDGLYYLTIERDEVAVIANPNEGVYYSGNIAIPENVNHDDRNYIVKEISKDAFGYCSELTGITIPKTVTSIDKSSFSNCQDLAFIYVESGNIVYDSRENCNAIIETETSTLLRGCKNTVIPNTVAVIGQGAFGNCIGLTSITIPNSVTSVQTRAFKGCSSLHTVIIAGATSGSLHVFNDCMSLKTVYCYAKEAPKVNAAFVICNAPIEEGTLYVPYSFLENYKATAGWKKFGTILPITYKVTYMVDGEEYATDSVYYDEPIIPIDIPAKEGCIFSGWSEIPDTMPAHDIVVIGSFEVNRIENITNDMVVDVYNLQGIKVKEQVLFEDLESILPKGMYIVNGNKVVVE